MPASTRAQASNSPSVMYTVAGAARRTASRFQNESLNPLPAMKALSGTARAFHPSAYLKNPPSDFRLSSGKNAVPDATPSRSKVLGDKLRPAAKIVAAVLRPAG